MNYTHYIGLPGAGKTTLMRTKIAELREIETDTLEVEGLVRYHKFEKQKTLIMGIYDDSTFAGCDKLSKGVGPKFRQWLIDNAEKYKDYRVLSEGERFSNSPTLDHLFEHTDMNLVLVQVSEGELERRRQSRNNTQNESWMNGMETRIRNLCNKYPHTALINE